MNNGECENLILNQHKVNAAQGLLSILQKKISIFRAANCLNRCTDNRSGVDSMRQMFRLSRVAFWGAVGLSLPLAATAAQAIAAEVTAAKTNSGKNALAHKTTIAATAMVIDGKLDEPAWQAAVQYNTFYQLVPATLAAHDNKVHARAFANADGVYVGLINYQKRDARQKQYNLQDGFMQADFNTIMLDFAGDGSGAYLFSVTLGGGIQDAAMTPQLTVDYDWDGVWQAANAETDDYWTTEFFLPWEAVSFRNKVGLDGLSSIGLSFQLYDLATNNVYGSQQQTRYRSDFYLNMPKERWEVPVKPQWQVLPYVTQQYDGAAGGSGHHTEIGLDLTYKPSHHQKISLALNPDFGQVDSDELNVNYSNVETLRTDKRPFFTQDLALFNLYSLQDTKLVHTRRIGAGSDDGSVRVTPIDVALRATHQGEQLSAGAFVVKEDPLSTGAGKEFAVLRSTYRQQQWQTGLLATHTKRPGLGREAETLSWDSQYQSATWSFQTVLSQSRLQPTAALAGQAAATLAASQRLGVKSRGEAFWGSGKYQFSPVLDVGVELLRMDDQYQINDLGYSQRRNWRYQALLGNYSHKPQWAADYLAASRLKHSLTLSQQSDDDGLQLSAKQTYLLSLLLGNGGQLESQMIYQTSGWQDNIGWHSDAFWLPPSWSRRLMYIGPYVGEFSWAASFQFDDEGLQGRVRQYGFDTTWLLHPNWTINFNHFLRRGNGWLVANSYNQLSSYDRELYMSVFKISGLLRDNLELGINLQWAVLTADTEQLYQVQAGQLQQRQGSDTSFSDQRLSTQFKLRYKLAPYSDLYLVYNRSGELYGITADDAAVPRWGNGLSQLWQQPQQDLWTAKIRYAF